MTATEKLRKLLDERGVEWADSPLMRVGGMERGTVFDSSDGRWIRVTEALDGTLCASHLTPEEAVDAAVGPLITEDTSDGWHSFKDLYHHRALLFSVIVHTYRDMCWKSKRHHDGKELDWNFIVGIDTPWGQASYHYGMEYWDLFDCKEVEQAPYYDGYTADESVARIARLVELDTTIGEGTCHDTEENPVYFTCSECGGVECESLPRFCPSCGRRVVDE